MPILATAPILPLDRASKSGRIYPTTVMEKAIKEIEPQLKASQIFGYFIQDNKDIEHSLDAIPGEHDAALIVRELFIAKGCVVVIFETTETPGGRMLEAAVRRDAVILRPYGEGAIDALTDGDDNNADLGGVVNKYVFFAVHAYDPSYA